MKTTLIISLLCLFLISVPAFAQNGSLVSDQVHAVSLERNLLGDSPDRTVIVYLPPGYEKQTKVRYPVVYWLHGYDGNSWNRPQINTGKDGMSRIREVVDRAIAEGKARPMIIVRPDASNKYGGSFYTNSATTGNWEDFITTELVNYIDAKYRTLPNVASRGIAGHSMGGYGAIKLAMKHPEIYGVVYGLSACCLGWSDTLLDNKIWNEVLSFKTPEDVVNPSMGVRNMIAASAAWSPNPAKAPWFLDTVFINENGSLRMVDDVHARWSANMPIAMADQHRTNLLRLRAIAFDVGRQDDRNLELNRKLSEALKRNQIKHTFEEYEGEHSNKILERIETRMLPFFSRTLEFSDKAAAAKSK